MGTISSTPTELKDERGRKLEGITKIWLKLKEATKETISERTKAITIASPPADSDRETTAHAHKINLMLSTDLNSYKSLNTQNGTPPLQMYASWPTLTGFSEQTRCHFTIFNTGNRSNGRRP